MIGVVAGCVQKVIYTEGNDGILPKNGGVICKNAICDLTAGQNQDRGDVIVSNDNYNLYVTFKPADGYAVGTMHVDVLCTAPTERGAPGQYQFQYDPSGLITFPDSYTFTIPFGEQSGSDQCSIDLDCAVGGSQTVYIRAHANTYTDDGGNEETGFGGFTNCVDQDTVGHGFPSSGGSWYAYIEYTVECCGGGGGGGGDGCRTQTMGGWGAPAHGENPGVIRDAVFSICFPTGMVLGGCTGGNSILIEHASDLEAFLPYGGKPGVLDGDYVNPTSSDATGAGVLAGQLAAIKMTLCADQTLADFSDCGGNSISGLCYVDLDGLNPDFEGLTVGEIVVKADEVIGGCSTEYSPGELADVLTNINENYDDGELDLGYLADCSG